MLGASISGLYYSLKVSTSGAPLYSLPSLGQVIRTVSSICRDVYSLYHYIKEAKKQ